MCRLVLAGTSGFLPIRLPKRITRIPANVKRVPANTICDALSDAPMENRLYPILIQGKALPQRKQQTKAQTNTTQVLLIYIFIPELFITSTPSFYLRSQIAALFQSHAPKTPR